MANDAAATPASRTVMTAVCRSDPSAGMDMPRPALASTTIDASARIRNSQYGITQATGSASVGSHQTSSPTSRPATAPTARRRQVRETPCTRRATHSPYTTATAAVHTCRIASTRSAAACPQGANPLTSTSRVAASTTEARIRYPVMVPTP
ncbi:Uncharacterised protein [Mycolicibacterium gilvum]|uniref:Uncharacterized protein n=1 Tax=Mycolicibacterium gilvum TaxID=1804 RepID=A0A378SI54_9MYCO|nr:hypothetical protein [Mycolicibacterium gilvum]STZ42522.1 Uncharacterised protein [Mycolicibacterium gilvum]